MSEIRQASAEQPTEIVIMGGLHAMHHQNRSYTGDHLKSILLALRPAAILVEFPPTVTMDDGRIQNVVNEDGFFAKNLINFEQAVELKASEEAARELGIRQIPFDRPGLFEYYSKIKFNERMAAASDLHLRWVEETAKNNPGCLEMALSRMLFQACESQWHMILHAGPDLINSVSHDNVIRIKHGLWYDQLPLVFKDDPVLGTWAEEAAFFGRDWVERNTVMAENINKAAAEFPSRRLAVVTGAEHRYILRDQLSGRPEIACKEFWEVLPQD